MLGFLDYHVILGSQLDHIYTAPYFVGLLGLLAASLAACTYTRQLPMVRVAKKCALPSLLSFSLLCALLPCTYPRQLPMARVAKKCVIPSPSHRLAGC